MAVRRPHPEVGRPQERIGRREAGAIALLTLLALALRVVRLEFQPLWWDEGYSVWFANQPLAEMVRLTALDIHPPLYYALLGGWSQVMGLGPVALRLFSVAAGVLAVPLIYAVGRRIGGARAGLLAAFLLAINPFHIFYSQEVRMYGLVVVWSLLALGCALRWLGLEATEARSGETARSAAALAGYLVAAVLALYTQYYAAFLVAGVALAGLILLGRRRAGGQTVLLWLGAHMAVLLLYLPWLLYAAPRLVPYVSQKVVADSDRPLQLLTYLARHLSAYAAGHMEGPLAGWWPLGLLALLPVIWALWRIRASGATEEPNPLLAPLLFLVAVLGTVLILGWLVNLTFPFFPQRGERLLLLALPLYTLLAGTAIAGATRPRSPTGAILVAPFVLLSVLSLAAFYTVPRYPEEDYRPLIGQVTQWGGPGDTVLAIYPWQVGYFWSYGQPEGPRPVLAADDAWGAGLADQVDAALAQGHLWFPEHLSLGGLLEADVESHLDRHAFGLANRWYSPSTRLTGWTLPAGGQAVQSEPLAFGNGWRASPVQWQPAALTAANQALTAGVAWEQSAIAPARQVSLRLADAQGGTWAQQDYTASSPAGPDQLGLLIPSGTPPGTYELRLSVRPGTAGQPLDVLGPDGQPQGTEAVLGQVQVTAPEVPPAVQTLPVEQALATSFDDQVRLLGFSATHGPWAPGGDLEVSLFWQVLAGLGGRSDDLFAFVQLLDQQGQVAAAWEGPPVGWHPTTAWQPGELVRSQHLLRLPATLADGQYRLIAGLFDPATGQRLTARPDAGLLRPAHDFVSLETGQAIGRDHTTAPPTPQVRLDATLPGLGRLLGYDLSAASATPGDSLDLTLYWQATDTTNRRLAVFVHLLDAQGDRVAQADGEPGAGSLPTSSWVPGEYLADPHRLTVRPDAAPGPATLLVGLYDPVSGQRVPWVDASGTITGDSLTLPTPVQIAGQ